MNFVFNLDNVICTPAKGIKFGIVDYIEHCRPIEDTVVFMNWLVDKGHTITIWCERPNDLAVKLGTERWLEINQKYSEIWPNIIQKKEPPVDNEKYKNEENKFEKYFKENL